MFNLELAHAETFATTTPGQWIRKDQNEYMRNTASAAGAVTPR